MPNITQYYICDHSCSVQADVESRSFSIVRVHVHVHLGRPGGLFQWFGKQTENACMTARI